MSVLCLPPAAAALCTVVEAKTISLKKCLQLLAMLEFHLAAFFLHRKTKLMPMSVFFHIHVLYT